MTQFSNVEQAFLQKSGRHASYEMEKSPIVEVQNVYELGQLVAISFLEWVSANPDGVIALPTGRTPEYFIKTLDRYRAHWGSDALIQELKSVGFTPGDSFPITSGLTFVMLDEFFPMSTEHRNSFCNYIRNFYVGPLGISDDKGKSYLEGSLSFSLYWWSRIRPAQIQAQVRGLGLAMAIALYCSKF